MILPKQSDTIHKSWLYKILIEIADNNFLASQLRFKGGTAAAMLGYIERFSVDLDFDLVDSSNLAKTRANLEKVFKKLHLKIDDQSSKTPQYFLKYENLPLERNTIKLDVNFPPPKSNDYEARRFTEIDRIIYCQTIETMFANKLVALKARYDSNKSIAGRDLFDVWSFFLNGFGFKNEIIEERTGKTATQYLAELKDFIKNVVTQEAIDQDLNILLPPKNFQTIRKTLKQEVLLFL